MEWSCPGCKIAKTKGGGGGGGGGEERRDELGWFVLTLSLVSLLTLSWVQVLTLSWE